MNDQQPEIVLTDRPRPKNGACPKCGAGKERRVNAAGFGPPVIVCGQCGLNVSEDA